MPEQAFSLIPFPAPAIPEITITGSISRQNNLLALHYALAGHLADIFLPSPSASPSRKDELWKTTCFEIFLGIKEQPQYWEFNLSPSGDWNAYHMDAYRRVGFREERSIQRLQVEVRKACVEPGRNEAGRFTLDTSVDLKPILREDQLLEVGITAVIQTRDGNETYWALLHPASQADFHLRESFILALAGQNHPAPQSAPES
ncbi:MAG TPA: DOMON-like domain-containing protein [Anaerolineales bacterium]|nr:DOMON-like domain-containing protein [Anaerolineales bacterium]